MEGVIFITDEIITDILNIELKDLEDFSSYSKDGILYHDVQTAVRIHAT